MRSWKSQKKRSDCLWRFEFGNVLNHFELNLIHPMLEDIEHSELDRLGILFAEPLQILIIWLCVILNNNYPLLQGLINAIVLSFCKVPISAHWMIEGSYFFRRMNVLYVHYGDQNEPDIMSQICQHDCPSRMFGTDLKRFVDHFL